MWKMSNVHTNFANGTIKAHNVNFKTHHIHMTMHIHDASKNGGIYRHKKISGLNYH